VEIYKDIGGVETVLGKIGQCSIFCEMVLIDSKPRMAAARASKGSTIILVTRAMFEQKLNKASAPWAINKIRPWTGVGAFIAGPAFPPCRRRGAAIEFQMKTIRCRMTFFFLFF